MKKIGLKIIGVLVVAIFLLQNTVSLETGRISTNLSTTALNNTSFTANINITGNTYMDSEKVGRMTAPAVAKTFRGGGAYAN